MVRVGFIGAGNRANHAHYPSVARIDQAQLAAICDLDQERLNKTADKYGVELRYTDYHKMLAEADLDAVYVVMSPRLVAPIAIDCLHAGRHVFMDKPPGTSVAEVEAMIAAAEASGKFAAVGFQRRFTSIVQEVKRLVEERGPVTMCLAEFHKNMLGLQTPPWGVSTLLEDIIHVVDLTRYLCGGEAVEVHAFQDRLFSEWTNCYNGMVRFSTGAVGVISGNRAAGARYLRFEVHGRGISAYLRLPDVAEVWRDNMKEPLVIEGAALTGTSEATRSEDTLAYEGTLAVNRHFIECVAAGREPATSLKNALGTMRLIESLEGDRLGVREEP